MSDNLFTCCSKAKLVALGETHHGSHNKEIEELALKMGPIEGIFFELPINFQPLMNEFVKTGKIGERLERLVAGAAREGKSIKGSFETIRKLALTKQCLVYCYDSIKEQMGEYKKVSPFGHYFLRGNSRDEDMAENVLRIIGKKDGKWLLIGGCEHTKYGRHFRSGEATLGSRLREKLGAICNICLANSLVEQSDSAFDYYFCLS